MRNIFAALLAVAMVLPVAVQAADVKGKISRYDAATKLLMLDNGASCIVQANMPPDGLAAGREVTITFEAAGGPCTRVVPAQ